MKFQTVAKKVTDIDRTAALSRALFGSKLSRGSMVPVWLDDSVLAAYLLDMGAAHRTVVAAFLRNAVNDSDVTINEISKFIYSLNDSSHVLNIMQSFTLMRASASPINTLTKFVQNGHAPSTAAHIWVAEKCLQLIRIERTYGKISDLELENIKESLGLMSINLSDEVLDEHIALTLDVVDRLGHVQKYSTRALTRLIEEFNV